MCCTAFRHSKGQMKSFYVGGPNQRKDYHIEEGEEVGCIDSTAGGPWRPIRETNSRQSASSGLDLFPCVKVSYLLNVNKAPKRGTEKPV